MTETLRREVAGDVTILTIDREERRNALDHLTVDALRAALSDTARNGAKVLVLTGAGTKSFCAGDDLKAYAERTPEQSAAHFSNGLKMMGELAALPCITIAAIEGYCMGGGLELAVNCDLRFASEEAVFALPEVRKLKANPTWGGLTNLPGIIGLAAAKRLIFLGERWSAEDALSAGLITRVTPTGDALAIAKTEAMSIAADTELAVVRDAKEILHAASGWNAPSMQLVNLLAERAQPFQG